MSERPRNPTLNPEGAVRKLRRQRLMNLMLTEKDGPYLAHRLIIYGKAIRGDYKPSGMELWANGQ